MKNYLITGATGFLGSIMMKHFRENSLETFTLYNLCGKNDEKIDITETFSFDEDVAFDIVVHLAGKAHSVPKTLDQEEMFYAVNLGGTKNLCSAIDKLKVKPKSFIFISTVAVYGLESGEMIQEDSPLSGKTPYANSKKLAEEFLINWAKENNIILGILRLPLIAGPNPPGNLGAMISGIRSGRYLSIGRANAKKSIVWAEDIADIIPVLAEVGGIYNITDGIHPSFKELEIVISKALSKSPPVAIPMVLAKLLGGIGNILGSKFPINSNKLDKITSTLTFDDTKARNMLTWKPSSVLEKLSKSL